MKFIAWIAIAFLMAACKGSGGNGNTIITPSPVSPGVYTYCENDTENNISARALILVTANSMHEKLLQYSALNCASGSEEFEMHTIYSYTRSGTTYTMTYQSATTTSLSASDVLNNETVDFCGVTDWTINEPVSMMGRDCGGYAVNVGDTFNMSAYGTSSGMKVVVSGVTLNYTSLGAMNFSNVGATVADGNYIFYNGGIGIYMNVTSPNYSVTLYDVATTRYYTENGTLTSSNNSVVFTVGSYTNGCGDGDEGESSTMSFAKTPWSLALKETSGELLMEKFSYTEAQFRSAFLPGIWSAGCF